MKNATKMIPCYSADTAGVCSAMYELGGMTVTHDASGCNSTYATHDEPRWYDMRSDIFISALTEMDAIMGTDEKLISDAVTAAADLHPAFITLCGSPMPMMTGTDFDAIAEEVERRSGIRTFPMHTNGTRSYIEGASEAMLAIVKEYVHECPKADSIGVNILGMTPLDFKWRGTMDSMKKWLCDSGLEYISCLAMGSSLDEIKKAASAKVNLVVSHAGMAAAQYLYENFGIPYVCGVPYGEKYAAHLAQQLKNAAAGDTVSDCRSDKPADTVIIGECISAASLASALYAELDISASVICPLPCDAGHLSEGDLEIYAEEDIEAALTDISPKTVIDDPLYRSVIPKSARLIGLPHFAFSGRCFERDMPDIINTDIKEYFK